MLFNKHINHTILPPKENFNNEVDLFSVEEISELILLQLQESLSPEKKTVLDAWVESLSPARREAYNNMVSWKSIEDNLNLMSSFDENAALEVVRKQIDGGAKAVDKRIFSVSPKYWVAAASILLLLGVYWYSSSILGDKGNKEVAGIVPQKDINPAQLAATLELEDGRIVMLDSLPAGLVSIQKGVEIFHQDQGTVTYSQLQADEDTTPKFNKITTPRGGTYAVVLPDGTKVWLNAASSIRFPTRFTGDVRRIELTGEAYFEVSPSAQQRFTVAIGGDLPMDIDVLGTSFNVNAYADEGANVATLVSGKISVSAGSDKFILNPGQEARLASGGILKVREANVEKATAWRNGIFYFQNSDVKQIMRQISRWYDVEVEYNGAIEERFNGTLPRNLKLSEIIFLLKSTGWMNVELKDNHLVVDNAGKRK